MKNYYLQICKDENGDVVINSNDGVFISSATRKSIEEFEDYCEDKANMWLESKLGNFVGWKKKDRKVKADMWLKAKSLSEGKYDYYFNFEDLRDVFREEVASLAKRLGIDYTLEIKLNNE